MDGTRFDALARRLSATAPRRAALRAVAAGLVAGSLGWRGEPAAAAPHPCTLKANGRRCTSGSECCSGRCVRKRRTPKKFCRQAPGQGICTVADNQCTVSTTHCNKSGSLCVCWVTESGMSWCGAAAALPDDCFACDNDADCQQRDGAQAGDRCMYCSSICSDRGTVCVRRCPDPA